MIDFQTSPDRDRHWSIYVDGADATLTMDVAEDSGVGLGYDFKLNSYDLSFDIELYDAVQRLRFKHPDTKADKDKTRAYLRRVSMIASLDQH